MKTCEDWPRCHQIDDLCPVFELSRILGTAVFDSLMEFSTSAQVGSRLTLQRNRNEFTSQVTGAVQRDRGDPINLDALRQLCGLLKNPE